MMLNTTRAAWEALGGRPGVFERTPKFGGHSEHGDWRRLRYQVAIDPIVGLEVALALFDGLTFWMALRAGSWAIAVYSAVFAVGLLFVASLTIGEGVRSALAGRRRPSVRPEPVVRGEPVRSHRR
jgi:hypothetical protein